MANTSENCISFSDGTLSFNSSSLDFDMSDRDTKKGARDEMIESLMSLYHRHKLTKIAVEDIAKLLNQMPGASVNIPETKYSIFKEFLYKSELKVFRYIFCKKCEDYSKNEFAGPNSILCNQCQLNLKTSSSSFIYLQVTPQLKRIIVDNYEEIMNYKTKCTDQPGDIIFDVCSGKYLKGIMQAEHFYSMTLNTDGVEIHGSSGKSCWPILLICNFLPPNIRFRERNIILASIYYDTTKPDFSKYFVPLVEEFELLYDGLVIKSEYFKFIVSHAAFDLPARAAVQYLNQFNGYNSCSHCEIKGVHTGSGVRFTVPAISPPMRTHKKMIATIRQTLTQNKEIDGIKGLTPMVGFHHFDLSKGFTIDYMHAVLLGLTKNCMEHWFDSRNNSEPFYITPQQKRLINSRISSIKPCRFINRKIIFLDQYKQFKASQFRCVLLYFYPVLDGFLGKKYYNHFRLLASSIYILLQPAISKEDLARTRDNLKKYVEQYQALYGKSKMTMNVHSLSHLADCVENMGPLWAYSLFSFESFNGTLKKFGENSTFDVVNQIIERMIIQNKALNIENKAVPENSDRLGHEISHPNLNLQEKEAMKNYGITDCKFYTTCMQSSIMYTSKLYTRAKATIDCYISCFDGTHGKIKVYFRHCNSNYALLEEYATYRTIDQIKEASGTTKITVISTKNIIDTRIYMKFGLKELTVMRPNRFEIN